MDAKCSIPLSITSRAFAHPAKPDENTIAPTQCKDCSFESISNLVFLGHVCARNAPKRTGTENEKLFECKHCEYNTKRGYDMRRHVASKHLCINIRAFKDNESEKKSEWLRRVSCEYNTRVKTNVTRKVRTLRVLPKVTCQLCNMPVAESYLKRHIATMHNQAITKYTCELCEFASKWKHILKKHVENKHTSAEEKQWKQCEYCDYKVIDTVLLKYHITAKHKQEEGKWHECSFCHYRSVYLSSVKEHILRKHTKDEDITWFKCSSCDYKAKKSYNVIRHVQTIHSDQIIRFKCEFCDHTVSSKRVLHLHIQRKHTSAQDKLWFICEDCGYKTVDKRHLRLHIFTKHKQGGKWHHCETCQYKTTYASTLKRHIVRRHVKKEPN